MCTETSKSRSPFEPMMMREGWSRNVETVMGDPSLA